MQSLAHFSNSRVDTGFSFDKKFRSPNPMSDFRACDEFSTLFDQQREQIHGTAFEMHHFTRAAQRIRRAV